MKQPDRVESRRRLARIHIADRFRAMFGERVEPLPKPIRSHEEPKTKTPAGCA